jgi:hypothetical protein
MGTFCLTSHSPLYAEYIQECVDNKRWPKLVLFKRSDDYVALSRPRKSELPQQPQDGASPDSSGWKSATVPRTPRGNGPVVQFSPRSVEATIKTASGERQGSVLSRELEAVAIPEEIPEGEATEWEEDREGDQIAEAEEALAPRYDHAVMAGDHLSWDQKSHISLWELVRTLPLSPCVLLFCQAGLISNCSLRAGHETVSGAGDGSGEDQRAGVPLVEAVLPRPLPRRYLWIALRARYASLPHFSRATFHALFLSSLSSLSREQLGSITEGSC